MASKSSKRSTSRPALFPPRSVCRCLMLASTCAPAVYANTNAAIHDVDFSTRLRYADLTSASQSGKASSIRLRLEIHSQWLDNISTHIGIDHVESGFKDEHSDGVRFNGKPVIPDVEGSDLNQAWVRGRVSATEITLGRQRLAFDDQRFIGGNGFWQNEQTFDALHIEQSWFTRSRASASHIINVNRIFGDDANTTLETSDINYASNNGQRPAAALGDHEHNTQLLRVEINEWDFSQWVSYGIFIDNKDAPILSSNTVGTRYTFKTQAANFKYVLDAEAALQERTEIDNTPTTRFTALAAGIGYNSLLLSTHFEQLTAESGAGFITPLGSLHEFYGWADQFSATPASGLNDTSLQLKWRSSPWKFDLRYHFFSATENNDDYGKEVDLDISLKFKKRHLVHFRLADFNADADAGFADETRAILSYSYDF